MLTPDIRFSLAGRGPIGELLERFHLRRYAEARAAKFQRFGGHLGRSTVGLVRKAAQGSPEC